jgi:two-component sensor histidine kinase
VLTPRTFDYRRLLRRIRRVRSDPFQAYGIAVAAVIIATVIRLALSEQLADGGPFTTYNPAIIVATFFGGFWPGVVALILSVVTGWYLFLDPVSTFALPAKQAWMLSMFAFVSAIDVILVSLLNRAIDRMMAHEDHQQFLIGELRHRSQNLFTVIQALASRTLQEGQTLPEAREALSQRLSALAQAHALLEETGWTGAPLTKIIERVIGFPQQVSIKGCDIVLNTPMAQNFALILHELATNAVKYGALSSAQGRVAIEGNMEGASGNAQFRLSWKERGGPQVTPPDRKGFGNTILFEAAKRFAHNVEAKYAPEGLTYDIQVILGELQTSAKDQPAMLTTPPERLARSAKA